jgi:hypothetical protein
MRRRKSERGVRQPDYTNDKTLSHQAGFALVDFSEWV